MVASRLMGECRGTLYHCLCYLTFHSQMQVSVAAFAKHQLGASEGAREVKDTQFHFLGLRATSHPGLGPHKISLLHYLAVRGAQ